MDKQPSLIKIITIDYAAFVAFLFPIVMWGCYAFLVAIKNIKMVDLVLPSIFAAITVVAIGVLFWRVQVFNAVFSHGIEALATISNVSFFRDRGRIHYVYTYQGQKYTSSNAVHKVRQTETIQVGAQVIVMIDGNNPKRAYIRDLYLKGEPSWK